MQAVLREHSAVADLNQVSANGVEPTEGPVADGGSNPPASIVVYQPRITWTDDSIDRIPRPIELLPEANIIRSWMEEAGRNDPVIHLSEGRIDGGSTARGRGAYIYMDPNSNLIATGNDGNHHRIGRFAGTRRGLQANPTQTPGTPGSCFLVNDNDHGQDWLNQLVDRVYNLVSAQHSCMRIPFAAIRGAQIKPETIRLVFGSARWMISDRMWIPEFTYTTQTSGPVRRFQIDEMFPRMAAELQRWNTTYIWQVETPAGQWIQLTTTRQPTLHWPGGPLNWRATIPASFIFEAEADNGVHRYISAYDHLENPPSYFLAQLPDRDEGEEGLINTLEQAFAALQPPIVRRALQWGNEVRRHGDIFFIRLSTTPATWRDRRRDPRGRFASTNPRDFVIYDTGHTAERIAVQDNGATLVSGRIRHQPNLVDPARTRPDHADLVLPRGWYLAVRNTVPA